MKNNISKKWKKILTEKLWVFQDKSSIMRWEVLSEDVSLEDGDQHFETSTKSGKLNGMGKLTSNSWKTQGSYAKKLPQLPSWQKRLKIHFAQINPG